MAATRTEIRPASRTLRRWWVWAAVGTAPVVALVAAVCWWLTAPLTDPTTAAGTVVLPSAEVSAPAVKAVPVWPVSGRLTGEPAKRLLHDTLLAVRESLRKVDGYSATFRKQERLRGRLGAEQTLEIKVRHEPFAVYFKFLTPNAGKEAVYAEGRYGNKLIAHDGGWKRRLIPRLALSPTDRIALADSRHPVTEAGLFNLTEKLIGYRAMDLSDPDAQTALDRLTDDDGRTWLRSVHTHTLTKADRPFARVDVLYDPVTKFPMRISNYDWPAPGESASELKLAEKYAYDDLDLDANLTDHDFDTANPDYAFSRY